jgi:hypothetical protein
LPQMIELKSPLNRVVVLANREAIPVLWRSGKAIECFDQMTFRE